MCPDHHPDVDEADAAVNTIMRLRPFGAGFKRPRQHPHYQTRRAGRFEVVVSHVSDDRIAPPRRIRRIVHPDSAPYLASHLSRASQAWYARLDSGAPGSDRHADPADSGDAHQGRPALLIPQTPIATTGSEREPEVVDEAAPTPVALARFLQAKLARVQSDDVVTDGNQPDESPATPAAPGPPTKVTRRRGRRSTATASTPVVRRKGKRRAQPVDERAAEVPRHEVTRVRRIRRR
ncbi:hypothetical protein [Amycolatopsis sp. NPDC059021]|uniref:hypothetical protein n=1 Tax=Amycolatopsis sp. NPDC059021 TaxID=3346704 RepID=UPI00366DA393